MDTELAKGRSRISRNSTIHYRNKNRHVQVKLRDLTNYKPNDSLKLGKLGQEALLNRDEGKKTNLGGNLAAYQQNRYAKLRNRSKSSSGYNHLNTFPDAQARYNRNITNYCCLFDNQSPRTEGILKRNHVNTENDSCHINKHEEGNPLTLKSSPLSVCAPHKEREINRNEDKNKTYDELETRVIGCKFELTCRLPGWARIFGLSKKRNYNEGGSLNRCLICKLFKKKQTKVGTAEKNDIDGSVVPNEDVQIEAERLDNVRDICNNPIINYLNDITRDEKQERGDRKEMLIDSRERRRGGGSKEMKIHSPNKHIMKEGYDTKNICQITKSQAVDEVRPSATVTATGNNNVMRLETDSLLSYSTSDQLHQLYRNMEYKVLHSITNVTNNFGRAGEFNISPKYSSYSTKTNLPITNKAVNRIHSDGEVINEIRYEDAFDDVKMSNNNSLESDKTLLPKDNYMARLSKSIKGSSKIKMPNLAKTMFPAVIETESADLTEKKYSREKKEKKEAHEERRSNIIGKSNALPAESDVDITDEWMDSIYENDDPCDSNENSDEKFSPCDNTLILQICVQVNAAYDRLEKLEKRIRSLIVSLNIDCCDVDGNRNVSGKSSNIPPEYKQNSYTITRDEKEPQVMHINPPTNPQFKTCKCDKNVSKDCFKINFSEKFEPKETCATCLNEYTNLVKHICPKNCDHKDKGVYTRLCDFLFTIFDIEPHECIEGDGMLISICPEINN